MLESEINNLADLMALKLSFVQTMASEALRVNPSTQVVPLIESLVNIVGVNAGGSVIYATKGSPEKDVIKASILEQQIDSAVKYDAVESVSITAPYPSSAIGTNVYDPIEATGCLPDFDKLPFQFCEQHSVIRSGEQTVIMNSAHYADLLQLRDTAIVAINDERVMRAAAEAATVTLSEIDRISQVGILKIQSTPEGIRVSYGSEDRVAVSLTGNSLRTLISELIGEIGNHLPMVAPERSVQELGQDPILEVFEIAHVPEIESPVQETTHVTSEEIEF